MDDRGPPGGSIRLRHAVALYTSSVLGSGILVLPGLTAQIAGPASLLAWLLLSLASVPFALTFASVSARRSGSVGIYSFAREAFGPRMATACTWLLLLWMATGAPAVALVAASYLAFALPLSRLGVVLVAAGVLLAAFVVNIRGIVFSNRVQLAVAGAIVLLLLATFAVAGFAVQPGSFEPFLPHGPLAVGTAAALIFWSFLGYENVSNVAGDFRDPERDLRRGAILSVLLVSVLYVGASLVTIGTRAYERGGSIAPFAAILAHVLGPHAAVAAGVVAVVIIFGTANAYWTGMSRVFQRAARDGGLPLTFAHVDEVTGAPDRALVLMLAVMAPVFAVYVLLQVDLATAFLVSGGAAILSYIIAFAAVLRMRRSDPGLVRAWMPAVSLVMSAVVALFVGPALAWSLGVVAVAFMVGPQRAA